MLTISGGKWRGRKFAPVVSSATRPTAIRAREGLFNVLTHTYDGLFDKQVADLFAGTGALGLEALSRGAETCVFIDSNREAVREIERIIATVKMGKQAKAVFGDATKGLNPTQKFDLVFMDPPYDKSLAVPTLEALGPVLKQSTLLVIETDKSNGGLETSLPTGFELDQVRAWGRNQFHFIYKV